ncbi:Uncharacterized protein HZ326_27846 [Fusarium oxysporum f. sp. albedinis]|nr:Uncharacterized protein HZ326_27846 [Fusarium oxysporum f. sp. albedinis]
MCCLLYCDGWPLRWQLHKAYHNTPNFRRLIGQIIWEGALGGSVDGKDPVKPYPPGGRCLMCRGLTESPSAVSRGQPVNPRYRTKNHSNQARVEEGQVEHNPTEPSSPSSYINVKIPGPRSISLFNLQLYHTSSRLFLLLR